MDPRTIEYAALAAASYVSSNSPTNRVTFGAGWTLIASTTLRSGFEAIALKNGTEIVIAYTGTQLSSYNGALLNSTSQMIADLRPDLILGIGQMDEQPAHAGLFYEKVKREHGPSISFAGHSLGGGLAALMGMFFNRDAITFDPTVSILSNASCGSTAGVTTAAGSTTRHQASERMCGESGGDYRSP